MKRRSRQKRATYRRSGRVAWLRFVPSALVTLLVAAGMSYCWFLAFDRGLNYWIVTPVVLALPIALCGYIAIALGHCRSRTVAASLGIVAALVYHAGYFHADFIGRFGQQVAARLDLLPKFIAERMATDGVLEGGRFLPRSELYNWFYSAVELLLISLIVAFATVYRSLAGYCESCHRWMRSILLKVDHGIATEIADALANGNLAEIPVTVGRGPMSSQTDWLEFEYCPSIGNAHEECGAYLTLKENAGLKEPPLVLMYQGRLEATELDALASRVAALAFLRVSAPAATDDEIAAGRSIERHSGSVAAMERLSSSAEGAALDRAGKIEFMLALVPIAILFGGIGLIVWGAIRGAWEGHVLLAVGVLPAVAGGLVCCVNVDYLGMRFIYRRLCRDIGQRPDALVTSDEPIAQWVDIVPRVQWHQLMPDKAADRGLLAIDLTHARLLFEGVKERYVIPADAVLAYKVVPMLPHTGSWNYFAVVLTVRYPESAPTSLIGGRRDDQWEIPFLPRPTQFRRYSSAHRRELAEGLLAEIEELLDRAGT